MSTTEPATGPLERTDSLIVEFRYALADGNPVLAAALAEPLRAADLAGEGFVRDQVIEALGPRARRSAGPA